MVNKVLLCERFGSSWGEVESLDVQVFREILVALDAIDKARAYREGRTPESRE